MGRIYVAIATLVVMEIALSIVRTALSIAHGLTIAGFALLGVGLVALIANEIARHWDAIVAAWRGQA